jgi:capsular exopolysaccharide synthesis family protein
MEFKHYLNLVWKWSWLVILAVVVAGVASYLSSKSTTPLYRTKTTVMVGRAIENPDPNARDFTTGQQLAQTYAQLAVREPVLRATIERLELRMSVQALASRVNANTIPQTQLIDIAVVDADPYRAKVLADTIAAELIRQSPTTPDVDQEQLEFTQAQLEDLRIKIERGHEEVNRLRLELDAANSSRVIQDLENRISLQENKINGWQGTYSQLLASLRGGSTNVLTVVEIAAIPNRPISPNIQMNVMLASVMGFVLSAGGIFLIEYLDDTIKSPEDIRRVTGMPTLGTISQIEGKNYPEKLISLRQPLSPTVESYRALRTNLQYASPDKPLHTIMVTSPNPGEGKSVTLANLAVVIAQSGKKVILVDTDMRRPVMHTIFGLSNRHGLSDAILDTDEGVLGHLQDTIVPNLQVLTSGPLPPNPSELLGSAWMGEVLEDLKSNADVVLFDSPPTQVVSDAMSLGGRVDGVLLVVHVGGTRSSEIGRAIEDLRRLRVNMLGIIYNRAKQTSTGYYYYYGQEADHRKNGKSRDSWLLKRTILPNHDSNKRPK